MLVERSPLSFSDQLLSCNEKLSQSLSRTKKVQTEISGTFPIRQAHSLINFTGNYRKGVAARKADLLPVASRRILKPVASFTDTITSRKTVCMQKLGEKILIARWKSYKIFKNSGEIRLHNNTLFKEFHFSADGTLVMKDYKKNIAATILQNNEWTLDFSNKKHYLFIPKHRLSFEIITVNHTVLVLFDTVSWDKIFLAREDCWTDFLQSNKEPAM